MNEQLREKAGLVYNIVESVILAMSVSLMVWLANVVITHGQVLAAHDTKIVFNTGRLDIIENRGSRSLETHVKEDDARIASHDARLTKLEAAVLLLQSTPGELKAIAIEIRGLRDSQDRIEKAIEDHMRASKP
jgi:hypothetical protein